MTLGKGWFGRPEQLVYVLATIGADKDADGRYLIYGAPIARGLDGDVLVPGNAEYAVRGHRASLAGLMNGTSYGLRGVAVIM